MMMATETLQNFFDIVGGGEEEHLSEFIEKDETVIHMKNEAGQTPLHWAAINGQTDVCKTLLDHGANLHAEDNEGRTALQVSTVREIKRLLGSYGAFSPRIYHESVNSDQFSCESFKSRMTFNAQYIRNTDSGGDIYSQIGDEEPQWFSPGYTVDYEKFLRFLPMLYDWLLLTEPANVCDNIINFIKEDRFSIDWTIVEIALNSLDFEINELDLNGDESLFDLQSIRFILDSFNGKIWIGCVLKVLESLETPLLSETAKSNILLFSRAQFNTKEELESLTRLLVANTDDTTDAFVALGELFSFIHDAMPSETNLKKLARVLGPFILMDDAILDFEAEKTLGKTAVAIFIALVKKCRENSVLTARQTVSWISASQYLKFFFAIRDRKYLPIVDELFSLHGFGDIARGIFFKYSMLPEAWKEELLHLKKINPDRLSWFDVNKVYFLDGTLQSTGKFPPVCRKPFYYELDYDPDSEIDKVVDEIIMTEKTYYKVMHTFKYTYLSEIRQIARGAVGMRAKEALGLSTSDIDSIFGSHFDDVLKFTKKLLVQLEVLVLVREPLHKMHKICRAGLIANKLVELADDIMRVYGSFHRRFKPTNELLRNAIEQVHENKTASSSSIIDRDTLNFLDLWDEISASKSVLKGKRIESVLYQPIKRVSGGYHMFFGRLASKCRELSNPLTYERVNHAEAAFKDICHRIDLGILVDEHR